MLQTLGEEKYAYGIVRQIYRVIVDETKIFKYVGWHLRIYGISNRGNNQ